MPQTKHQDLLAAVHESPDLRAIVRRLAALDPARRDQFVALVRADAGLNLETRMWLLRVARNEPFLAAARERLVGDPERARTPLDSPLAGAISSVG